MNAFDMVVTGSGPAGAMAAYTAASRQMKVLILEKETLPRYKTCGGGLVYRARTRLPFDISPAVQREFFELEVFFEHASHYFSAKRTDPIISMVMRDEFDALLVKKAREKGAQVMENTRLEQLKTTKSEVLLQTSVGEIKTRYLIAADGILSPAAKMAGWTESRKLIPALEYEVSVGEEDFERLSRKVRFDVDAVPYGYAWCFPKKNHLSLGVACLKKQKINLKALYEAYLKKLQIGEILSSTAHGFQIPIGHRVTNFSNGPVFLVGDAAGFADPLTAEGISNALLSGELAASAICDNFDQTTHANLAYKKKLQEKLLPELKTSALMARIFYAQPSIRNLLIQKYGQRGCEMLTDIFMGKTAFPTDIKKRLREKIPLLKFR
ncbi:geranylgeranyl reductase family [Cyclobacterium lianum]|uniref:Geranylgeranyl reductase family n=1 Tax=Cyclobacterium lianum TaxID=388280 RepID=A0A1M7L9U9_9BACT|nr:geranylgeranyl reductase family protein [Cyclobacterium lianum]SHM74704.1 geranylgeranyl reductase family [Cyclobacterium lianum]